MVLMIMMMMNTQIMRTKCKLFYTFLKAFHIMLWSWTCFIHTTCFTATQANALLSASPHLHVNHDPRFRKNIWSISPSHQGNVLPKSLFVVHAMARELWQQWVALVALKPPVHITTYMYLFLSDIFHWRGYGKPLVQLFLYSIQYQTKILGIHVSLPGVARNYKI